MFGLRDGRGVCLSCTSRWAFRRVYGLNPLQCHEVARYILTQNCPGERSSTSLEVFARYLLHTRGDKHEEFINTLGAARYTHQKFYILLLTIVIRPLLTSNVSYAAWTRGKKQGYLLTARFRNHIRAGVGIACGWVPWFLDTCEHVMCHPKRLLQPKYRLGHAENYVFSFSQKIVSRWKYPKNIVFDFEKGSC